MVRRAAGEGRTFPAGRLEPKSADSAIPVVSDAQHAVPIAGGPHEPGWQRAHRLAMVFGRAADGERQELTLYEPVKLQK